MNFPPNKPFIVAEMSCNHLGSADRALEIIDAAADVGADAIKLQVWDYMVVGEDWKIPEGPWSGRLLDKLYEQARTPWKWLPVLFRNAKASGIICFASVFDEMSLGILEKLDCPIYKIASCEIVDLPLIRAVADIGKPMIISTGMASSDEIDDAVEAAKGAESITLLHCVSAYPTLPEHANLWRLNALKSKDVTIGISDHSLGIGVSVAAVALGAEVVEKHLTLSRADGGPDAEFSMEPDEFKLLVSECRRAYQAKTIHLENSDEAPQRILRRSLWFAKNITKGTKIEAVAVCTARPALGLTPKRLNEVIGKTVTRDVKRGEPVTVEVLM